MHALRKDLDCDSEMKDILVRKKEVIISSRFTYKSSVLLAKIDTQCRDGGGTGSGQISCTKTLAADLLRLHLAEINARVKMNKNARLF